MFHRQLISPRQANPATQRGSVLTTSMILLFAITMVTVMSAKLSVTDLRLSGNEIKSVQAIHSADAGLEDMLSRLADATQRVIMLADVNADSQPDGAINGILGNVEQSYAVTLVAQTPGNFTRIWVNAVGCADTCSGTCSSSCPYHKAVSQLVVVNPVVNAPPNAPLVARGSVAIPSSPDVINNIGPEVVRSGGGYTDNSATTLISNGVDVSALAPAPPFVVSNDTILLAMTTDAYFESFFSASKTVVQASAQTLTCGGLCLKADLHTALASNNVVWVNDDVTLLNDTFGSAANPVIIIVNGNLEIRGGATVYGLVYVTALTWDANGAGNANINGTAIAEGNFATNGNITITYDPTVMNNLNNIVTGVGKVSGTWSDF